MSDTQLDLTTVPAARSLAAVLRKQLDAADPMRLLAGIYGQPLASNDPDRFSHVNVVLGGASIKVPKLAGLSTVPNAVAYVLATKDFLIAIGSVGSTQQAGVGVPIGALVPFAGSTAPGGFLLCNGQLVSRTTYALLFSVIGTTYGAGDGSTTFAVPDLRGVAPYGAGGGGLSLGSKGGSGPFHHHSFSGSGSTGNSGAHQHGAVGDHSHAGRGSNFAMASSATYLPAGGGSTARYLVTDYQSFTQDGGGHQHPGVGDHSHSVSVGGDTSGGGSQDVPGYIGLNYVIRAL